MNSIGSLIRKNRIAQNFSVTDLAEAAGISQAYLSQIETGSKPAPSEAVLMRIAKALEVPAGILLATKGDKTEQLSDDVSLFLNLQHLLENTLQNLNSSPTGNSLSNRDYYWNNKEIFPTNSLKEVNQFISTVEQKVYPPDMRLLISEMLLLSEAERDFLGEVVRALKKNLRSHNQPV